MVIRRGVESARNKRGDDVSIIQEGDLTHFSSDADNTGQSIKGAPGLLRDLEVSNPNSADAYIQLFDLPTGDIVVGTTTPKLSYLVPAGDGSKDGAMDKAFGEGIYFDNAISYTCTVEVAGSTDPTVGLIVNAVYS